MHTHAPASIMQTEMIGYIIFILPRFIDKGNTSSTKAQFDTDLCITTICLLVYTNMHTSFMYDYSLV